MTNQSFTTSFTVDQSPDEVFRAITNVRDWWTGDVEGSTEEAGAEFTYRYRNLHYSKQRITELDPGKSVVWRVTDARLSFADQPDEWVGTEVRFDIGAEDGRTEVRFAHVGLGPELDCFDNCSSGWGFFINSSLRRLITTGEGPTQPPWA
jgi:activator of Hsp90 ATPase-like protein